MSTSRSFLAGGRLGSAAVLIALFAAPAAAQLEMPKERESQTGGEEIVLPPRREKAPEVAKPSLVESSVLAATLLEELVELRDFDESRSKLIAAQWVALGEDGIRAARAGLTLDGAMPIVTASRVLAGFGTPEDRAVLDQRLSDTLPRNSVAPLIATLRTVRPRYLTDERMVGLLEHTQATVRSTVERELRQEIDGLEDLVEELGEEEIANRREAFGVALTDLLDADRSDTRSRSLELLMRIGRGLGREAALRSLRDESPRVAARAVELLADLAPEDIGPVLTEQAFSTSFLYRDQAYAVLALVEVEERTGTVWMGEEQVPMLLESLRSNDLLASGAAALALAGIGFRGAAGGEANWYDLEVPHALVRSVSGAEFHQDIGPVSDLARRRLLVVTGKDFGPDGPAWRAWWTESARGFRARRAGITLREEDLASVAVRLFDSSDGRGRLELLGPQAVPSEDGSDGFRLSEVEMAELVEELRALELFTPTRLPGRYGTGSSERSLEIQCGRQAKRFTFTGEEGPAWFTSALESVDQRIESQRWQLFLLSPEAAEAAGRGDLEEVRARWETEAQWWRESHPLAERDRRSFDLVLEGLVGARGLDRERRVRELGVLEERSGVVEPTDFAGLLRALEREVMFGERTQKLVELALEAAVHPVQGEAGASSSTEQQPLEQGASIDDASLDRARELFDRVHQDFRETGAEGLATVLDRAGLRLARELVFDSRATARRLATEPLAASVSQGTGEAADLTLFERLLADSDMQVEIGALEAVGHHGLSGFLPEVLARSRAGAPPVRAAALLAAGELGGDRTVDAMIAALASSEFEVQSAAVRGLGALGAQDSSPILLSILSRGSSDPLAAVAEEALADLGSAAWPDLLRTARTPNAGGRRQAALLLARGGAAQAVRPLIDLLTLDLNDSEIARELALLTLIDFRGQEDPAGRWWEFVESTGEIDDLVWLRRAQDRAGIPPTPFGSLGGPGTRAGAYSLWRGLGTSEELIVERSYRELKRLLNGDLEPLPAAGRLRDDWRTQLLSRIDARYESQ